jgi:glycosyltransferase involved in cell wall biosynthesis
LINLFKRYLSTRRQPHSHEIGGIVFLEANPWASRLHLLGPMISGAVDAGHAVHSVLPERRSGVDLTQLRSELADSVCLLEVRVQRGPLETPTITALSLLRLLAAGRRILRNHRNQTLVLTAIDDYFSLLPLVALFIRALLPRTRVIVVRYRVDDLVSSGGFNRRQALKRLVLWVLEKLVHPETAVFDERVPPGPKLHLLPDPWTGPFGSVSRSEARMMLALAPEAKFVLMVGRQDERKGFAVAVDALKQLRRTRPDVEVILVGKVSQNLQSRLLELKADFGKSFRHVSSYLSDEEIALYFAASNAILLPYHTAFTSTSGVLVRAAASATPVVASRHGLVGWRTTNHSLGQTFTYPDYQDLCSSLADVLETPFNPGPALEFARQSTATMLSRAVKNI